MLILNSLIVKYISFFYKTKLLINSEILNILKFNILN